jgi:hypothetical protein
MNKTGPGIPGRWDYRRRDLALVIWVSFLAACFGTFITFAVIDPEGLNNAWVWSWELGRKLTYSVGFLFFMLIGVLASALTVFMIRTGPRSGHYRGKGKLAPPRTDRHAAEDPVLGLDPGEWRED